MPRRIRIDVAGYYHIINRGVEKKIQRGQGLKGNQKGQGLRKFEKVEF